MQQLRKRYYSVQDRGMDFVIGFFLLVFISPVPMVIGVFLSVTLVKVLEQFGFSLSQLSHSVSTDLFVLTAFLPVIVLALVVGYFRLWMAIGMVAMYIAGFILLAVGFNP